jgi:hypothetical protein
VVMMVDICVPPHVRTVCSGERQTTTNITEEEGLMEAFEHHLHIILRIDFPVLPKLP